VERLQKILSRAGIASRRASEQLMLEGRVTVNGVTVRELGTKADPARDDIRADGRRIAVATKYRYILLNKPAGYVTTRSDPEKRPTVIDLLKGVREYVYPVGRLDFASEGLLLLTNDGELAARLTHPRHEVARVYEVRVLGVPDDHDLKRLARGIVIEGVRTRPTDVSLLRGERGGRARVDSKGPRSPRQRPSAAPRRERGHSTLVIVMKEGRNRQVRKMCDAIGHPVESLTRVAIGPIRDERLKPGQWRELTEQEVARLHTATGADKSRDR
jgi:pseudouridine synthase